MDYRLLARYLGILTLAFGVLLLPSALWAIWFREWGMLTAFAESIAVAAFAGGTLFLLGWHAGDKLFQREALGLVGIGWLLAAAIGALPFAFSGALDAPSAWFESMSGLTTTGATVISDIEAAPKSLLFWRAFTHWIGGMGIIVLFVAVLPYLGAGGKQLFKSEAPGPDTQAFSPRIRDTASVLWKIYLGLTAAQTVLLMLAGMNLYDALCHTFATLATGGFSTKQASIGAYDSVLIESIVIVFMVIAGTNFGLFYIMRKGDWRVLIRDSEWRIYIAVLATATLLLTVSLMAGPPNVTIDEYATAAGAEAPPVYAFGSALRAAAFQSVSIMTTTGFATSDFEVWPYFAQFLLVLMMFVGGCGGSTGGGIKVVRFIILAKVAYHKIESTYRPRTFRPIRLGDHVIDDAMQRSVAIFFVLHMFILGFASLIMAALGLPVLTAVSSVVATLNNIGPGLEFVGSGHDFHLVPDSGKVVLSICMVLGRLELFSILVLFLPSFWRHS